MFEGIVVSSVIRQIRDGDHWMDMGILEKIQFVSEREDLSNNRVGFLPTEYFVFVGSIFRFISCAETKLDLIVNVELLLTVFGIVISFGECVGLVYGYLYVFS